MKIMKRTMKTALAIALSAAMTVGMFPMTAGATGIDPVEAGAVVDVPAIDEIDSASVKSDQTSEEDFEPAEDDAKDTDMGEDSFEDSEDVSEASEEFPSSAEDEEIIMAEEPDSMTLLDVPAQQEGSYVKYTSYTADAGSAGCWGDGPYRYLVDNNMGSKWGADLEGTKYVEFHSTEPISPVGYVLITGWDTATNAHRNPQSWNVYAKVKADDEWEVIDAVTDDTTLEAKNIASYTFMLPNRNNEKRYQYFRYEVTKSRDGNHVQLSEFQFLIPDESKPKKDIKDAIISGIEEEYAYTGDVIDISYEVTALDGTVLEKGTDYTEAFTPYPVKEVGTYKLTLTGAGDYTGETSVDFAVAVTTAVALVIKEDGTEAGFTNFDDAADYWISENDAVTLRLLQDVKCSKRIEVRGKYNDRHMILDLNDHGIILQKGVFDSVIEVEYKYLEIWDESSSKTTRYIKLTDGSGTAVGTTKPESGQEGIDYLEVTGGFITGANSYGRGGAVNVNQGILEMHGGTLCGNVANEGGGIFSNGSVIMLGGKIIGNTAKDCGGGIASYSSLTIKGGEISGNASAYEGCAVYIGNYSYFKTDTLGTIYAGMKADGSDAVIVSAATAKSNINSYGYYFLDPTPVRFNSVTLTGGNNATTSGGDKIQTGLTESMTSVTFTAIEGYYFEKFELVRENGIFMQWIDEMTLLVSGHPNGEVTFMVPDAIPEGAISDKLPAKIIKEPEAIQGLLDNGGPDQELVTAGEAIGGVFVYAVTQSYQEPDAEDYSVSIPTGADCGGYYVWYKVIGDSEHLSTPAEWIYVEIKTDFSSGPMVSLSIEQIPDADYTGTAIKPVPVVKFFDEVLTSKDYTISYKNNTNAANEGDDNPPTVIVKGKGNFTGTASRTFTINKLDIIGANVPDIVLPYNAKVQEGKTAITYELDGRNVTLKEGTDYTLSYSGEPKEKGVYTVTVTGIGNYTGTTSFTETIVGGNEMISRIKIPSIPAQEYSGKAFVLESSQITDPELQERLVDKTGKEYEFTLKNGNTELVYGKDYELSYESNEEAGTATVTIIGIGDYAGTKSATFKINGVKLSGLKSEGFNSSFPYIGSPVIQDEFRFYYMEGKGKTATPHYLEEDKDYVAHYDNNVECGTATVIFEGIGKYYGTVKKTFTIKGIPMSSLTITGDFAETTGSVGTRLYTESYDAKAKAFIYTGMPFEVAGPANAQRYVTNNGISLWYFNSNTKGDADPLRNGVDYVVTYKNNVRPGTAEVIFTGKRQFTGSVKKTFKIKAYDIKEDSDNRLSTVVNDISFARGGAAPRPEIAYCFRDETSPFVKGLLKEGTDYTLKWANNNAVTTADTKKKPTVTITGKGAFTGSVTKEFSVTTGNLDTDTVIDVKDVRYAEKPGICKTTVTLTDARTGKKLVAGKDYEKDFVYSYADDTIVKQAVYTGKKITGYADKECPAGSVVNSKEDVIPAGTGIDVTVTGKGGYSASSESAITGRFYVIGSDHDLSKATITISSVPYTGSKAYLSERNISIRINNVEVPLHSNVDYEIIYDPKVNYVNKGTYKVTIKGIGQSGYGFSKVVSFKITAKSFDGYYGGK